MAKYIEQDAIYRKLEERYKYSSGEAHQAYSQAIDDLLSIPVIDVVEVVRCGKCRLGTPSCLPGMIHCANNNMEHRPNCYCSYGERKDKQNEDD